MINPAKHIATYKLLHASVQPLSLHRRTNRLKHTAGVKLALFAHVDCARLEAIAMENAVGHPQRGIGKVDAQQRGVVLCDLADEIHVDVGDPQGGLRQLDEVFENCEDALSAV